MDKLNRESLLNYRFMITFLVIFTFPIFVKAAEEEPVDLSTHFWVKKSINNLSPKNEALIAGVILTDGGLEDMGLYISEQKDASSVEYYRQFQISELFDLLDVSNEIPIRLIKTASPETLNDLGLFFGEKLKHAGLTGCIPVTSELKGFDQFNELLEGIEKAGVHVYHESFGAVSFSRDQNVSSLKEIKKPKKQFQSFAQSDGFYVEELTDSSTLFTDWLNHDILILEEDQLNSFDRLNKQINANKWYKKIAEKKTDKNTKWLLEQKETIQAVVASKPWAAIQYEMVRESFVIAKNDGNLPFKSLEEKFLFIGKESYSPFVTSMSKYAKTKQLSWQDFDESPGFVLTELSDVNQLIVSMRSLEDLEQIKRQLGENLKMTIIVNTLNQVNQVLEYGSVVYLNGMTTAQLNLGAQILFGGIDSGGYIPSFDQVGFKGRAGVLTKGGDRIAYLSPELLGINQKILDKINPIIASSIQEGAFPGCQIAIVKGNSLIYEKAFGYFTYDSIFPVKRDHLYDLASVTKVAATLQAVMFLQEQGLVSLDDKLGKYLPEVKGSNKEGLLIKNILLHEAGLKPYLPFWKITLDKDRLSTYVYQTTYDSINEIKTYGLYFPSHQEKKKVWQEVIDSDLRKLGKNDSTYSYRYSDLGFMLLQMLVEKVSNQSLDEFVQENIYQPLGLTKTLFNPLKKFPKEQIAPTEYDYHFRNAQIWGSVHDQNSQVLGGVAGHAGLFSNAHELSKLFQMNLNGGKYGNYRFLHEKTLKYFTSKQKKKNRRGLGWDKPSDKVEITSSLVSSLTFGHTGFTGTAVWVDPKYDLIYVFLSNRIYPSVKNRKLMENNIRNKIQDVIYEAMGLEI